MIISLIAVTYPSIFIFIFRFGFSFDFVYSWKKAKVKSLSCVWLFATLWTEAHEAPPSLGFSRQEYWSGLPFSFSGDLPNPVIELWSLTLWADSLLSEPPGNACIFKKLKKNFSGLPIQGSPSPICIIRRIWCTVCITGKNETGPPQLALRAPPT